MPERVEQIPPRLEGGRISCDLAAMQIARKVMNDRTIVLLTGVYPEPQLIDLRDRLLVWGREVPPVEADDFEGNYHRRRVMVSRLQQAPHVFHDYNFNDFAALDGDLLHAHSPTSASRYGASTTRIG